MNAKPHTIQELTGEYRVILACSQGAHESKYLTALVKITEGLGHSLWYRVTINGESYECQGLGAAVRVYNSGVLPPFD